MTAPISSPCRKLCQLHPIDKVCRGCFRTIDEISRWARLSEARRRTIMDELPERRRAWVEKEERLAAARAAASGGDAFG